MAKTIPSEELARRTREMLGSAESSRKQMLQRFADEAEAEAQALSQVREVLAKQVGPDDPRVKALDRRAAGSRKVRDFAREGAKDPGTGGGGPGKPPADDVHFEVKAGRTGSGGPRQVTGKVTDASGKPMPDLRLELFEKDRDKPSFTAKTDNKGEFAFMNMPAGALTVKLHVGDKVIERKISSR